MRILVVGAGAVGGYFGARLIEKGVDVTFLVRTKRQGQLKEKGLIVNSIHGDIHIFPQTITTIDPNKPFDIIILATKAYHFTQSLQDIKPFIDSETTILPLLNGIQHLEVLKEMYPNSHILGGLCFIESTLDMEGNIWQKSSTHDVLYGELSGENTERIQQIEKLFSGTKANFRKRNRILTDMWHKYMHIAGFSGITTLFRSSIGPILESEYGLEILKKLYTEIDTIMKATNAPIDENMVERQIQICKQQQYTMKSSMLLDMEKGQLVEADHLQGYLLQLAKQHQIDAPYLELVYTNLKIYLQSIIK